MKRSPPPVTGVQRVGFAFASQTHDRRLPTQRLFFFAFTNDFVPLLPNPPPQPPQEQPLLLTPSPAPSGRQQKQQQPTRDSLFRTDTRPPLIPTHAHSASQRCCAAARYLPLPTVACLRVTRESAVSSVCVLAVAEAKRAKGWAGRVDEQSGCVVR